MKVLSIKEPWATLIKNKKKFIETRSWKTKYRGELYIHASISASNKWKDNTKLLELVDNNSLNFGYIVCKCKLVDCIYMTKNYIENIKVNSPQEYICGEFKEGRYSWILEDITPLEIPIKAKGQLNIWNYYDEFKIMDMMKNIKYGWIDKNNHKNTLINDSFANNYVLQTPKEVINNEIGVCFDQVELERYYFKSNDYNIKTYFIVYYDQEKCPTHTFLTFKKDNKYYWFEHSWERFRGIHKYNSMTELLLDVNNKFIKYELNNNCLDANLIIREYIKPKYHISTRQFYNHCENGKIINVKTIN